MMNELMRAHRLLCSRFIAEDMFRYQIGGPRSELNAVMSYLARPIHLRPVVTPFFDAVYYTAMSPDAVGPDDDPLLHFLETGLAELRAPHPLIDVRYVAALDPLLLGQPPGIEALMDMLDFDLANPSAYFDLGFYASEMEAAGIHDVEGGLLRHFLTKGASAGHKPNPYLDPAWYAAAYRDVPADPALATRHFVIVGDREARNPGPNFDSDFYGKRYSDVEASRLPPLLHFIAYGRDEGRQPIAQQASRDTPRIPPGSPQPTDAARLIEADAAMRRRIADARQRRKDDVRVTPPPLLHSADPITDARALRFRKPVKPKVSVLIPVFNELAVTVECLMALQAAGLGADTEIVIADDASSDADCAVFGEIKNVVLVRHATNLGFLRSCNAAFARCRGTYVLLLNNDTQIQPDALAHLRAALDADSGLAAVGPKLLYPNGRLQEAGCAVRPNGESVMVGLFADPAEGGYNHDRDVAYCSGAALLLRRSAVGPVLFDEIYHPAYCEDTDLCLRLRQAGHRIRYIHKSVVVHHLSVSTNQGNQARKLRGIVRNQNTLLERWGDLIRTMNEVRVLAFFLPQFHPTPENDLWWGTGFTEWTNVTKAQPSHEGHYQPHLPADLGFYDLRLAETFQAQAALARRYGVEGFVIYHYNFGKQRMLHRPLATLRANADIDIRFCLCWANENWTRHWDGGARELLLEQLYDTDTIASVIGDAVDAASDPRAITVDGKPLFLVYRPLKIPDPKAFAAQCREAFTAAGFAGVHLAYVESMEAVDSQTRPVDLGFDACVEFPPHGKAAPGHDNSAVIKEGWAGYRYDYPDSVINFTVRDSPPYTRYPAVFPSWDNTPRQPAYGSSFDAAIPEAFRVYVEEKIDEIRAFHQGDARLLFVNAWNEWAEGAHLEPDTGFGHRWLEALRSAVETKRVA